MPPDTPVLCGSSGKEDLLLEECGEVFLRDAVPFVMANGGEGNRMKLAAANHAGRGSIGRKIHSRRATKSYFCIRDLGSKRCESIRLVGEHQCNHRKGNCECPLRDGYVW